MAEDIPANGAADAAAQAAQAAGAQLNLLGQYISDLSFENPNAPQSILPGKDQPKVNVGVSLSAKKQSDEIYASELTLSVKAEREDKVLYNIELVYGGLFQVKNIPEDKIYPMVMIECPRLLFPFARQVIASTVQQGGFPPIMLQPIDFVALFQKNHPPKGKVHAPEAGSAPN
jgi:preprotein translocase subunit SecB